MDTTTTVTPPTWATLMTYNFTPLSASHSFLIRISVAGDTANDSKGANIRVLYGLTGSLTTIGNLQFYCRKGDNGAMANGSFTDKRAAVGAGQHTITLEWQMGDGSTGRVRPVSFPDYNHAHIIIEEVNN